MCRPLTLLAALLLTLTGSQAAQAATVQGTVTPAEILDAGTLSQIRNQLRQLSAQERQIGNILIYLRDYHRQTRDPAALQEFNRQVRMLHQVRRDIQEGTNFLARRITVRLIDDPQGRHNLPRLGTFESVDEFLRRHALWVVQQNEVVIGVPIQRVATAKPNSSRRTTSQVSGNRSSAAGSSSSGRSGVSTSGPLPSSTSSRGGMYSGTGGGIFGLP
jgi:hypothetical protein